MERTNADGRSRDKTTSTESSDIVTRKSLFTTISAAAKQGDISGRQAASAIGTTMAQRPGGGAPAAVMMMRRAIAAESTGEQTPAGGGGSGSGAPTRRLWRRPLPHPGE